MQSNQDILFSVDSESEWIYFNVNHQPTPVVEFIPYPIAVSSIYFSDGTQQITAGGGATLLAGPGITLTPGPGSMTISADLAGIQTPWLSNIDANGFSITNLTNINGIPVSSLGPAGANTQIQWNNNGSFGANPNLVWDNANSRLGIGTANPQYRLEINGDVNIIGTLRINGIPLALS